MRKYILLCILVLRFLRAYPLRLLVNRQPSCIVIILWRFVLLSLKAVSARQLRLVRSRINPLICAPMGGDYDGDEMTIHALPAASDSEALRTEMDHMSPVHPETCCHCPMGKCRSVLVRILFLAYLISKTRI